MSASVTPADWVVSTATSYRRVFELATGGMGRVDLAFRKDGAFVRLYAVKRPHAHLKADAEVRAMFLEEARIAGLLRHPNVVSVVDLGEDEDGPFLVMDYVEGVSTAKLLRRAAERGAPLPLEVAIRIAQQAAEGLHAAHELTAPDGTRLGLVHRDVSPHNLLVGFDGVTRVTDFGISKALGAQTQTSTGILKGKLAYMAPEQLRFRKPDARADLFSFGVTLFELVAGARLYREDDAERTAERILNEPPPDLGEYRDDVPAELTGLLFALLAKDPAARPQDARAVARILEAVLAEVAQVTPDVVDTGDYVTALFAEERDAQRERVATALARVSVPPTAATVKGQPNGAPSSVRSAPGWVAAAVALGVLLALGVSWALWPEASTSQTATRAEASSLAADPSQGAPAAASASESTEPQALATTRDGGASDGGAVEAQEPSAPKPSRRRPARKRSAMGAWEWQR